MTPSFPKQPVKGEAYEDKSTNETWVFTGEKWMILGSTTAGFSRTSSYITPGGYTATNATVVENIQSDLTCRFPAKRMEVILQDKEDIDCRIKEFMAEQIAERIIEEKEEEIEKIVECFDIEGCVNAAKDSLIKEIRNNIFKKIKSEE